jgi:hypothetical protein
MDNENAEAKKMFFDYCCNHFFMLHNSESDKYAKYRISKRQEKLWRKEFITYWISRLDPNDVTALDHLKNAGAIEALPEIILQADKGDGYAKLRYADAIWWIADIPWYFKRKPALDTAIRLWKSLVEKPFEITEEHKAEISKYLNILELRTSEEYIVTFAKRNLSEKAKMK